ncbi:MULTISPECIES: cytochrome c oxidase assembly protein [Alphaproteobacteria]|uniref:Cytochrome c oxidase assembly protein CtaG n=2 Tax=Alphaproteobacteria TaxID=28211 RepID=A0A512HFE3_9HYPH|nr:cytochrome c oxidase assembly protein [Ciceribacter naphthalenivorans]GEO84167.1 cytochrome c oxidase assembly protein CtaG [Ciceribacter naphthalenivorans]GLR24703.1 cytochrome c oxidase assembly protein CtaG [Ciceribacter naphthalenivorans]GLT07559.1 cytochrome c oxidase assembly protein CtaG [Sphingomonas psychrolutea]
MAMMGNDKNVAKRGNATILVACVVFVGCMVGASFASVPLYRIFCQVTGYNGTTQRVEQASDVVLDKTMKVTFDANVSSGLNWDFKPIDRQITLKIGETVRINYTATNRSPVATTGQAIFNVTPMEAAAYFNKVECFCFTETELKPGESLEMPVVFFVDPAIVEAAETKDIGTITLSYTFYPHEGEKPVASLPQQGDKVQPKL